ncbi:hypothetical protein EX30DRAFT_169350 [Ascodesmis nigricans]|uniref:Uncharacterized protein n=1 Tax=Ascodesmis nigricans TaxID=341454 RepID=A0A4S2MLT6_9PEZI|nr:hypothetical protein EX30DRAFT_169350 [Ascodesmis nigricans]
MLCCTWNRNLRNRRALRWCGRQREAGSTPGVSESGVVAFRSSTQLSRAPPTGTSPYPPHESPRLHRHLPIGAIPSGCPALKHILACQPNHLSGPLHITVPPFFDPSNPPPPPLPRD